jgi:CTP synthase (UTP-ammonia lyase)
MVRYGAAVRHATVNLLIDYPPEHPYHRATVAALEDASGPAGVELAVRIAPTDTIDDVDALTAPGSAVFIGPGTPYREPEAANRVIAAARERGVPLVAT